ncbi:cysteine--tRNA ligase [Tepidiforma flava]|uniref:Cysteine--tRNA ligase n=1 Tax=Tepidiforma flava TaxID=3004094 RepID=A0ABY7M6C5_9CHLR|nr:cysteine--tRNA ligase [Tepidiforma flava]WBL35867.1 cysteine--tRNA ligase [Tepidiforma flava]
MPFRLFTSLGNEVREFRTVSPGEVRMYVCGVTPYDVTHLGHAFSYVQFDALRRYLGWLGYRVRYVQNVTDIDDDMIMVSRRQGGRPIAEIRDENDAILRADLDRLNVLRPTVYPYATDHIPEIIETTARLIERGHAYVVDGDVFFDVASFPRYGRLNGLTLEELGKRENPESKRAHKKRGHLDFLLWQQVDPGDPAWDSPWGPGRPGWSIECTAMAVKHLGTQIDIHGGGSDLKYPHHENEIAQAECAYGVEPFCGWWVHNGMLQLEGVKMSKSLGNLVLARDLMRTYEPDHLRLYLLSHHLRADANYVPGALDALAERYGRLKAAVGQAGEAEPDPAVLGAMTERLGDDFDVPGALEAADAAASRVLAGAGRPGVAAAVRAGLQVLGFAFAGARGPANGDVTP